MYYIKYCWRIIAYAELRLDPDCPQHAYSLRLFFLDGNRDTEH